MKKRLVSFLLLFIFAVGADAQKPEEQTVTEKHLREHVFYLASDALEGRRTGEKGGTFAAGYIANMFASYKLKGGYLQTTNGKLSRGYLQPFPHTKGVELGKSSRFQTSDSVTISDVALKTEWAPLGLSPNAEIPFSEVVFAGLGIKSEKLNYNNYKGLDIKDKIVIAFDGVPDNTNPHNPFFLFTPHAKANIAKELGAKGLILISREEDFADDKLALRFDRTLGEIALPTIVISRQSAMKLLKISETSLRIKERILNQKAKSEARESFEAPIDYRNFEKSSYLAKLKIDVIKRAAQAYNVIGIIEGSHPMLKNEAIIIGAHYDHLGRGGAGSLAPDSNEIHNGADDNASGTAAIMELARQFSKTRKNRRTLIFIGFSGEESGLLGSKAYTKNPVFPLEKTVAMINMDMVGRLTNRKLTVGGIGTAGRWKDQLAKLNIYTEPVNRKPDSRGVVAVAAIRQTFALQLNQDGFGPSDHSSFYAKKIPVLFFFTGTHSDYHKPSDDAEKINFVGLEAITNFVSQIVTSIDLDPVRPKYRATASPNTGTTRRGFNVSLGTIPSYADNTNDGLVLDGVRNDSPADKAGLKAGDKIIKLAAKEIRNISDYVFVLGEMTAGETYEVVVLRGAEKITLKIVPAARK